MAGRVVAGTGWAVSYAVALVLGRQVLLPDTGLALFWPAAGVAALWMVWALRRPGWWWHAAALLLLATVAQAVSGVGWVPALVLGGANLTQGLTYAAVVRAAPRRVTTTGSLLLVLCGALVSAPLGALVGVAGAVANGAEPSVLLGLAWVVRNACATFVVVTLALAVRAAWARERPDPTTPSGEGGGSRLARLLTTRGRAWAAGEYAVAALATALLTWWVFGTPGQLPLSFVVIVTSVWVGSRFSPVVAAVHSLLVGVVVAVTTLNGLGPLGTVADLAERALLVQLFVLANSALTQLLAAGLRDRHSLFERALRSEQEARRQKAVLDTVLDVMQDGLVVVDDRGRLVVHNAAARRLGAPGEGDPTTPVRSARGYGLSELDGGPVEEARRPIAEALSGSTVEDRLLLRHEPDTGRRRVLSVNASPLRLDDPGGEPRRLAVVSLRDITDQHAYVRELEGFTGMVAHDLRNPLAAAISWIEVVTDQVDELAGDTSAVRSSLARVQGSAQRAMDLVQELLEYARAGDQPLEPVEVDLTGLVGSVVEGLAATAPPRVSYDGLGRLCGDPTLLRQLFTNLLGNAAKYVAPGVVPDIRVSRREERDDRGVRYVVLEVADNGIGIDPASRSRVFDTFFRAPTDTPYAGTGLGLAICARVAERHGGTISAVENPATGGTVVRVRLPVD